MFIYNCTVFQKKNAIVICLTYIFKKKAISCSLTDKVKAFYNYKKTVNLFLNTIFLVKFYLINVSYGVTSCLRLSC